MTFLFGGDPIINSPFREPDFHWKTEEGKDPVQVSGRRLADYVYQVPERAARGRQKKDENLFQEEKGQEVKLELVNSIRKRLKEWKNGSSSGGIPYDGASTVTRELLDLWHSEHRRQRLFFAQIEAAETIIFLTEARDIYRKDILSQIPRDEPGDGKNEAFLRYACRMATGSGKTTVMGMIAAWSILNFIAAPQDNRFTDTVLIVCPNVTIRERLKELKTTLRKASIYYTRELVPPHRMQQLSQGTVMIANWHQLERKEVGSVNNIPARVIKKGVLIGDKRMETEAGWHKRLREQLSHGRGRARHWMVFNDEAHHAYRRGDFVSSKEESEDYDKSIVDHNNREATVWIEALDLINRLANGGEGKGINFCLDLSATPFYIQGSGNEVGKPFPWIVSSFSLMDAIESGLVKVPQIAPKNPLGEGEHHYFNIWRWAQLRAAEDNRGGKMTPEIIMSYATAPINTLASNWKKRLDVSKKWDLERGVQHVPPVFIVVCRDTQIAKAVYGWLANDEGGYGASPPQWFRNKPGKEVTVRIDSRAMEDMEEGGSKNETKRLRFILDTIGKREWPNKEVPEEWSEVVRKYNAEIDKKKDGTRLKITDETIPPGRNVRCIVSVSMLTEGWDANNVTHIVGLRPFGSQLLCEQVVGRALRRQSYVLDEANEKFSLETSVVFGVPFKIMFFKAEPSAPPPKPARLEHIFSEPEKARYRLTFPKVTHYSQSSRLDVHVDLSKVSKVTIDPAKFPPDAEIEGGEKVTLEEWRKMFARDQKVAARLTGHICRSWLEDNHNEMVRSDSLFAAIMPYTIRFLREKLVLKGTSEVCDVLFVEDYASAATSSMLQALRRGSSVNNVEKAVIYPGEEGIGSTDDVDFYTSKETCVAKKCHLNRMVADTKIWEQSAGYILDRSANVKSWVKNERLGFFIYYSDRGRRSRYFPDFIVELDSGLKLILEIKGQETDKTDAKEKGAGRWVDAVNNLGAYGTWAYHMNTDPVNLEKELKDFAR